MLFIWKDSQIMQPGWYFFNERTVNKNNIHNQSVSTCGKKYPHETGPTSLSSNLTTKERKIEKNFLTLMMVNT